MSGIIRVKCHIHKLHLLHMTTIIKNIIHRYIMKSLLLKYEKVLIDISAVASVAIIGTYYESDHPSALHEVFSVISVGVLFYAAKRYISPVISKYTPWKK